MSEVLCWCCKYFVLLEEHSYEKWYGICENKNVIILAENKVCEEFILKSGLHTKKTIPDYCRNKE